MGIQAGLSINVLAVGRPGRMGGNWRNLSLNLVTQNVFVGALVESWLGLRQEDRVTQRQNRECSVAALTSHTDVSHSAIPSAMPWGLVNKLIYNFSLIWIHGGHILGIHIPGSGCPWSRGRCKWDAEVIFSESAGRHRPLVTVKAGREQPCVFFGFCRHAAPERSVNIAESWDINPDLFHILRTTGGGRYWFDFVPCPALFQLAIAGLTPLC